MTDEESDELTEHLMKEEAERAAHEKDFLTFADLSASEIMPPTALDLAHLAAALDPVGCNGGSLQAMEKVIASAVSLYAVSKFYLEENRSKSAQELIMSLSGRTALLACWEETHYSKIVPHNEEVAKLKFYRKPISNEPDEVCKYFGVKDVRSVVTRIDAMFRYWEEKDEMHKGQIHQWVKQRWANRRRTDDKGRVYYAFDESELKNAQAIQKEVFRARSDKSAQTKKNRSTPRKKGVNK